MVQELIDLRNCILESRYDDALAIVDELEGMSKQATLRNIGSFLLILLIHLIKNQSDLYYFFFSQVNIYRCCIR